MTDRDYDRSDDDKVIRRSSVPMTCIMLDLLSAIHAARKRAMPYAAPLSDAAVLQEALGVGLDRIARDLIEYLDATTVDLIEPEPEPGTLYGD